MSFKKKMLLPSIAMVLAASVFAQNGGTAARPETTAIEAQILSIDLGMVSGVSLDGNKVLGGRSFGLGFTVSDFMSIGVADITANANEYLASRFTYALIPELGFNLYVGSNINPAVTTNAGIGAGVYFTAFRSQSTNGLVTALKIRADYLFDTENGVQKGDIVIAACSTFGL